MVDSPARLGPALEERGFRVEMANHGTEPRLAQAGATAASADPGRRPEPEGDRPSPRELIDAVGRKIPVIPNGVAAEPALLDAYRDADAAGVTFHLAQLSESDALRQLDD